MSAISGVAVTDDPQAGQLSSEEAPQRRGLGVVRRFGPAVGLYGVVKLLGFGAFMWLLHFSGDYRKTDFKLGGGARPWDVLGTWDGWWYQDIAANWYHPQVLAAHAQASEVVPNSAAFFPLYPGLMRLISETTGLGVYGAGMLVAIVSSFFAAAGIYALVDHLYGRKAGIVAAALFAVMPGAGVEWAVYSDSLFLALAAWALYALLKRNWLTAGVLALISGLNRPTSAAVIAAVGLAALIALFRRKDGAFVREDGVWRPLTAMLIAPWGFIGYLVWVGWKMNNLGGYFMIQKSWNHYFDGGHFILHAIPRIMTGRFGYLWAWPYGDTLALAVLILAAFLLVLFLRMRPPLALIVFTVLTILSTVTSQQLFCNIPRYLLPAFTLWIPVAVAFKRVKWPTLVALLVIAGLASGWYAGYVTFELGTP